MHFLAHVPVQTSKKHVVTVGTVGQRFLLIKKRWENKKNLKNALFYFKIIKNVKTFFTSMGRTVGIIQGRLP